MQACVYNNNKYIRFYRPNSLNRVLKTATVFQGLHSYKAMFKHKLDIIKVITVLYN